MLNQQIKEGLISIYTSVIPIVSLMIFIYIGFYLGIYDGLKILADFSHLTFSNWLEGAVKIIFYPFIGLSLAISAFFVLLMPVLKPIEDLKYTEEVKNSEV